jgi:hypothetical protein
MAINYTWKITSLKKANSNNLENVIIGTRWECIGTDDTDGVSGTFVGATPFSLNSVNSDNFIEYSSLTEEQVLGWIKNHVSGSTPTNYWDHISERIQKAIDASRGVVQDVNEIDLPWSPVSGSNSGSIAG